jgi:hypothetical protein
MLPMPSLHTNQYTRAEGISQSFLGISLLKQDPAGSANGHVELGWPGGLIHRSLMILPTPDLRTKSLGAQEVPRSGRQAFTAHASVFTVHDSRIIVRIVNREP